MLLAWNGYFKPTLICNLYMGKNKQDVALERNKKQSK